MARRTIRLACGTCDRDDGDGITPAEAKAAGWTDISRYQTMREACLTYADPRHEPPGYSVLDWMTHFGTCPDCAKGEAT